MRQGRPQRARRIRAQALLAAAWALCIVPRGQAVFAAERPSQPPRKLQNAIDELFQAHPAAPAKPSKSGRRPQIHPAQTSTDATYGYTRDNPIKVGLRERPDDVSKLLAGVRAAKLYLSHLRDAKGRPFRFRRHGSSVGADGHIIDRYVLADQDGRQHRVWIDIYHPNAGVLGVKAPRGMLFSRYVHPRRVKGTPRRGHPAVAPGRCRGCGNRLPPEPNWGQVGRPSPP